MKELHDAYFALGVSLAQTLCPDLVLQEPLYTDEYRDQAKKALRRRFGEEFEEYFSELLDRLSEGDIDMVHHIRKSESLGVHSSFDIGNTYSIEQGFLGEERDTVPAHSTWVGD